MKKTLLITFIFTSPLSLIGMQDQEHRTNQIIPLNASASLPPSATMEPTFDPIPRPPYAAVMHAMNIQQNPAPSQVTSDSWNLCRCCGILGVFATFIPPLLCDTICCPIACGINYGCRECNPHEKAEFRCACTRMLWRYYEDVAKEEAQRQQNNT